MSNENAGDTAAAQNEHLAVVHHALQEAEVPIARPAAPEEAAAPRREGWRCAGLVLAALVLTVVLQGIVGVIMGAWGTLSGQMTIEQITALLAKPTGIIVMILCAQAGFLLVALRGARVLPGHGAGRLGLTRSDWSPFAYIAFVLGTIAAAVVGTLLATPLALWLQREQSAVRLWEQIDRDTYLPYLFAISVVPGLVEEILFRGVIQRRLLRVWRPFWAILLTSVLFGAAHLDPVTVVFAFVLGLWLGVLAWRTGSIWPSVVCHAGLNLIWNVFFIWATQSASEEQASSLQWAIVAAAAVGLVVSIVMLLRRGRAATHSASEP